MSEQITTALTSRYRANVELLLQREGSQLAGLMRQETQKDEFEFFQRIGATKSVRKLARHSDSPQIDTPHSRRRVHMLDFHTGDTIDKADDIRTVSDFRSPYAVNMAMALGRDWDDTIIDGFFGNAHDDKTGATVVAFPSANVIARDFVFSGSAAVSGLTVGKLLEAKRLLTSFHNRPGKERWHILVTSRQMDDLLHDSLIQNIDTNIVRALVQGDINVYAGFVFHTDEGLKVDSANGDTMIPAWVESGMLTTTGQSITTRIAERADKSFSNYIYVSGSFGASRMEENKVVQILCNIP